MQITKIKCDTCGKEVADHYAEKGWIELSGFLLKGLTVSISIKRSKEGVAKTIYRTPRRLDFCSVECLALYFEKLAKFKK